MSEVYIYALGARVEGLGVAEAKEESIDGLKVGDVDVCGTFMVPFLGDLGNHLISTSFGRLR